MINKAKIIETAETELRSSLGYHFSPDALRATVEAGLQVGDKINIGGGKYGEIIEGGLNLGDTESGKVLKTLTDAQVNEQMLETLLKCKSKTAALNAVK